MAEISFGDKTSSRMFFGDKTVAKIYTDTEELYNGVMTIRFQKGDYISKIYRTGTSTDLSSVEVPKESTVYQSGGTLHIIAPYEYDRTYNASLESTTAQYSYAFAGWGIFDASDVYIQDVPTSAGAAYTLQDGYLIRPYGSRSLRKYNLTVTKTGDGVGTIDPSLYSVYYGSTINPVANGSIGNGYARFTITPPSEIGGSATTISIPVTVLASGDANFGYYYFSYSWNTGSFTLTEPTTITITGTTITRTYTITITAASNLYIINRTAGTTTSSCTFNNVSAYEYVFFQNAAGGGSPAWGISNNADGTVTRDPDNTPNMYGFDTWSTTYDNNTELGVIFRNSSASRLYIDANRKIVWSSGGIVNPVTQANPAYVNGTQGTGSSNSPANPTWQIPIWSNSAFDTSLVYVECSMRYTKYTESEGPGTSSLRSGDFEGYLNETFTLPALLIGNNKCTFTSLHVNGNNTYGVLHGTVECNSTTTSCCIVTVNQVYYKKP